jgi:hypothetical protein
VFPRGPAGVLLRVIEKNPGRRSERAAVKKGPFAGECEIAALENRHKPLLLRPRFLEAAQFYR